MKTRFIVWLSLLLTSSCFLVMDVTINQKVELDVPVVSLNMPLYGYTNIYAETVVSNSSADVIGQTLTVRELRLAYIISNRSDDSCRISVAISTNYSGQVGETIIYDNRSYIQDQNQTAFVVDDLTLNGAGATNGSYVSTAINPVVMNALLYSQYYAVIMKVLITNEFSFTFMKTTDLRVEVEASLKISKEVSDMPHVVSLIH